MWFWDIYDIAIVYNRSSALSKQAIRFEIEKSLPILTRLKAHSNFQTNSVASFENSLLPNVKLMLIFMQIA